MANFFERHASDIIKFNIGDFEGPIDLLYTLIVVEGRYDINTYPLASITNQYMEYMKQAQYLDIDIASDFLVMATTLLEIKSRNVLPKIVVDDDDLDDFYDDDDPEETLRMRLSLFALLKEQSILLKAREQTGKFYRDPVWSDCDAIFVVNKFDFDSLIDSYGQMLVRFSDKQSKMSIKKITRDKFTVHEKIVYLSELIKENKKLIFGDLFNDKTSKSEIISTFQALLELMKKQIIKATQECHQSDIIMQFNEELEENTQLLEALKLSEGEYNE